MGWFNEQIRQRTESDQSILESSFFAMASVVMDKWSAKHLLDEPNTAQEAVDEILKYYHEKPSAIPEDKARSMDLASHLEAALRPSGLMVRDVELERGWQNEAYGPMLGCLKETGTMVALLPGLVFGYTYRDPDTGRKIRITNRNADALEREALCFYRPLPMKKLDIPDLMKYMIQSISASDAVMILLASLAVTLVGMLEPQAYNLITGSVMQSRNINLVAGMAIFLVCSAFSAQIIAMMRDLLMERIGTKAVNAVSAAVMIRILSLPVSFFRSYSSGELSSRASSISSLCSMILNNIFSVGLSSLLSLLYVAQIFAFAPTLVAPSLLIILSTVVVSISASLVQMGISRQKMQLEARESGMSYSMLTGVQKIRLSGSENRMFALWGRLYSKSARLEYNPPMFLKINKVIVTGISLGGTALLYYLAVQTGVAVNEYYAFNAAYARVMAAFTSLAGIAISVAGIKPVLEMAEPILKAAPEVAAEKRPVSQVSGSIDMDHVSFRYDPDTPYILNDLNLSIKAGEYVAIVGRTGCGKSTLVRLLLGFEKPEKGSIFYDQTDLATIDPRTLRKNIGVVIQNGQLFQGDIFSNITISAPQLTLKEAWEAAEIAGIAQDIREMPMGMNTVISEGQGGISGGQRQRLMIARAVAPKPRILIFDEATSALDNKTQQQVSEALDRLQCTRIVIAHRLSTIRNCDRILVMDKGVITEEGTYEELIAQGGFFAELVERQRLDV